MNVSGETDRDLSPHSPLSLLVRITGASLDLVRTAKLVLEEYFSLGDTVNDMNKILLKDTKPLHRPTFSLGPPDPPAGPGPSKLTISGGTKSAFEVSQGFPSEIRESRESFFCFVLDRVLALRAGESHHSWKVPRGRKLKTSLSANPKYPTAGKSDWPSVTQT